jgi:MFS family permease
VVGHFADFFVASAGASAAILGLLVVAVTLVNSDDANHTTRELRTVLAGSAFLALVDIFIVSIVSLTGGSVIFGLSSLVMAAVSLLATSRLIPRARRAGNFSRDSRTRTLNIVFASVSAAGYTAQLGLAAALLADSKSSSLQRALVLIMVVLYCSALGRAWVVSGISRRAPGSPADAEPGADAEMPEPLAAPSWSFKLPGQPG